MAKAFGQYSWFEQKKASRGKQKTVGKPNLYCLVYIILFKKHDIWCTALLIRGQ